MRTQQLDTPDAWINQHRRREIKERQEDSILSLANDSINTFAGDIIANMSKAKKVKRKIRTDNSTRRYTVSMYKTFFTTGVNNDYFINRYQPYKSYQGDFKVPVLTGLAKGGFSDLFENHHLNFGYSLPVSTNGSNFSVRYENTERNIDWGLSYFRKVEKLDANSMKDWRDENGKKYPENAKVKTHYFDVFLTKPFTFDIAIGFSSSVRYDRTIFLSTDKYSLDFLPYLSTWSVNSIELNINRLKPTIPFLNKGFRVFGGADLFRSFSRISDLGVATSFHIQYHMPIYKYITIVSQAQGAYSFGDNYMLYNLGGVDNNLTPTKDTSVTFSQNLPYAFQKLVTPFRGYMQNGLFGNKYMLLNLDTYFPIFKTIIPIETPMPFINNLQLGVFSDCASAIETWNVNSKSKSYLSAGFSIRSTLSKYPIRFDCAWPLTTKKPPLYYFSIFL